MKTRPLTEESEYTCDWGGCNEVAVCERADGDQWLSVCATHGPRPGRPAADKGSCSFCRQLYTLSTIGNIRLHSRGYARCAGSGQPPLHPDTREASK